MIFSDTKALRSYVQAITGFKCSVKKLTKGSCKGNYIIAPAKLEDSLAPVQDELKGLGFFVTGGQSAFLAYREGCAL